MEASFISSQSEINILGAFSQPVLTKNNIHKNINMNSLSQLRPEGKEISVKTQRLHSLINFAGDDEMTSY